MGIERFFPKYPSIYRSDYDILNTYGDAMFDDVIVSKKEFADLKLTRTRTNLQRRGDYYDYQKYIARFMSSVTGYDELLLFHEPGSGKTCTAIATIEALRYEKDSFIKGALIFAKGQGLLKNFVQELLFVCTDGRYIPENYDSLTDYERVHRTRKITEQFYSFFTFETFAKELSNMSDQAIKSKYDGHVIIIDEVHNLREKDDVVVVDESSGRQETRINMYSQFHRLCHILTNRKILLMSGTPMTDGPEEIASVMNLILPTDRQLPPIKEFIARYFGDDSLTREDELTSAFRGRISYLRSPVSNVRKIFVGSIIGNLKHFVVDGLTMSQFQTDGYSKAYAIDRIERAVFTNSRQASLFVFPDGTSGKNGFDQRRFVDVREIGKAKKRVGIGGAQGRSVYKYALGPDLAKALGSVESIGTEECLQNLARYSCKYAKLVRSVLLSRSGKSFVYCEYVNGSGAILLSLLLDHFGFGSATGNESAKGRRYALVSNQTSSSKGLQKLINRFNERDNARGEFIQILIGSKVINEGFTLKDVTTEFILTPHWNYGETSQAIARGWRLGSHDQLLAISGDATVSVYQMVALPNTGDGGIDLHLYETAERKDVVIKRIERLIKTTAFDCPLAIEQNHLIGLDGQRECEYETCDYDCSGTVSRVIDRTTNDIYRSVVDQTYDRLSTIFLTRDVMTFSEIATTFAHLTEFELTQALYSIISQNRIFRNRFHHVCFLRYRDDIYYLTSDLRNVIGSTHFDEYYAKNVILLDATASFNSSVDDMYSKKLPELVQTIFDDPQHLATTLTRLPLTVQRIVLEGCIMADARNIDKNRIARDKILNFYKGFYGDIGSKKYVWLYSDSLGGAVCLDGTEWKACELPTERKERRVAKLKDSPIGYYGLYNPKLDDFCIKDVGACGASQSPTDLRKLRVGRRCIDWERSKLIDIVVRRMKLEPPIDYRDDVTKRDLADMLKKIDTDARKKYVTADDYASKSSLRRMLFWIEQNRTDICDAMKKWFIENDLLEENFDCGHQKKKRANR